MRYSDTMTRIALTLLLGGMLVLAGCAMKQPGVDYVQPPARVDFWIGETGPTGPLYSGPQQYPFICTTYREGLGQPLIDNQDGIGNAVFRNTMLGPWIWGEPVGFSRYCSLPTRVDYVYYSRERQAFLPLTSPGQRPADIEKITVQGETLDFVVRVERGTLNRFLYSIAMLAPHEESLTTPAGLNNGAWNGRLVYKFRGGVGIGHWQGGLPLRADQALHYEALRRGYAVAFSSGTTTATHYNLMLAQETAEMLKGHFVATYGEPEFTIGLGGSGGAIQQYVLAQNSPGLLDGIIPQLAYPDMVTQVSYVADCDLLERYFDRRFRASPDSKWGDWWFRTQIEGGSASGLARSSAEHANPYAPARGASTCTRGWRGHAQRVMNPLYTHPAYGRALDLFRYPEAIQGDIKWTHWNDLANIYPVDPQGHAETTWGNVGVQYGLQALRQGLLSVDEFLQLNACVGSWKPAARMAMGAYPWDPDADPEQPDPWDAANMQLRPDCETGPPAPRRQASAAAIRAARDSGQVFRGDIDIPVIDLRWYLDPALDIHHSLGSFAARARMFKARGHADNQVIWVAACESIDPFTLAQNCPYDPTGDALEVMGQWLSGAPPIEAVDRCLDHKGRVLHAGASVWDGVLNDRPAGACAQRFPAPATARTAAGEPIRGDIFRCRLKPVATALSDGSYGDVQFGPAQRRRLAEVFPEGVCAYEGLM